MNPVIGIDLGTTHSAVAHLTADGPRLIPNALGEPLTPSVVGVEADGTVVVGRPARELQVLHPERCAGLFKRLMGTEETRELAGRKYTPEELSGLVLRALKADAEAHLGCEVTRAVVTVPAYFNDRQRKATLHAGRIAGLTVERILNEPTAAALAYGFHEAGQEKTVLVVDLGGGTFDVSVVDLFEGSLEVRASAGDGFLGGEDFTRALAARVLERRGLTFEAAEAKTPRLVSRLLQQCEAAKRRLSAEPTATVRVPDAAGELPDGGPAVEVTRRELEDWVANVLNRLELPVRRALGDARLKREDVTEVVLVGGATRMPVVRDRVARMFNQPPRCRINPDEVVALGAAVQAGLVARAAGVEDLVVADVAPFTLGIEVVKRLGQKFVPGYYMPMIDRNTVIPVSRAETVSTVEPNQRAVTVKVYQGEGRRVEDNLLLGEFTVTGVPPGPAGQEVEVRFTYDLNGVLEVEATVVATKKKVTKVIAKHAKGLTPEQVERAVAAMAKLKTHPREEAVNRLLLRRAERLYGEMPTQLRDRLGELLDGFEAALGSQDAAVIEAHRGALEQFLSAFDPDPEAGGDDGTF